MARKAETTFIASVHRHLAVGIHREKMNNPYRSGTADVWYSGQKDLWVEYKFLPKLPKRMDTFITLDLSELQKIWLRERHHEGRNVAVICGCKAGGVVFNGLSWDKPISNPEFASRVLSRPELAAWLETQTGAVQHGTTQTTHRDSVLR
jgi:hypothetical protein